MQSLSDLFIYNQLLFDFLATKISAAKLKWRIKEGLFSFLNDKNIVIHLLSSLDGALRFSDCFTSSFLCFLHVKLGLFFNKNGSNCSIVISSLLVLLYTNLWLCPTAEGEGGGTYCVWFRSHQCDILV